MTGPQRGWTERRITASSGTPAVTVRELDSGEPGPTLLVLGGVHGNEVGGIVAAGIVASTAWNLIAGRLLVVPIAHEVAYEADLRVSPLDAGNLARSLPGAADGGPTEQLAWLLTHELIARADVLIDLHTSSPVTEMPLFVGCLDDGSPAATRAVDLATSFGIPLVWTHPSLGPGRTLTAARDRGIPALYVESPGGGVLREDYLLAYVDGVRSVLENLGMVADRRTRAEVALWLHGDGDTDTFSATSVAGLFLSSSELMKKVERDEMVGTILDTNGTKISEIAAPTEGYVTTLQRSAVVEKGQSIVGVTQPRPSRLGFSSDRFISRARSPR